jgi:DNA-binding transcriptional LysR family regulator
MDIKQLEVLLTVVREKSFSRAADALGRTQPAISQAIRRLEDDVGETLFDRSSKDGTLTPAGEVLFEHAEAMLALRQNARNAIRELKGLQRGKVTISANEHTVLWLLPVIDAFLKEFPSIKVVVQRGVASRIPKQITAREVELGVISFAPESPSLASVPVLTDDLVMIVSPAHILARKGSISISEAAEETFIAHNAPSPLRRRVIEAFAEKGLALQISVELPSLEAIKLLVMKNAGAALVPRLAAHTEIEKGQLVEIRVSDLNLRRDLHIVYRRNAKLSHAAEAFLAIARSQTSASAEK